MRLFYLSGEMLLFSFGSWALPFFSNIFKTYATIPTNQWFFAEIEYNTNGAANLWIDGSLVKAVTGQTLTNNALYVQGDNAASFTPTGFVTYGGDYTANTSYVSE